LAKFWLNIAPNLYNKMIRKNISIQEVLNNNRWVRHILPLTSEIEIREYVGQWEMISQTPRNMHNKDESFFWRWTRHGDYTTKSAYRIQFMGDSNKLKINPI
jgi:hypothetical protein